MTAYAADHETGLPLCGDCALGQCREDGAWCEAEHCECMCRRATELDGRPDDKLAVIADELDRERLGDLRDLTAERFGAGRRP